MIPLHFRGRQERLFLAGFKAAGFKAIGFRFGKIML